MEGQSIEARINILERKTLEIIEELNKHTKLLNDLINVVNSYTTQLKELAENPSIIENEIKKQLKEEYPDWKTLNIRKELDSWFGQNNKPNPE